MLHVVPILCLVFFIFFIEIRLKSHVDENDKEIERLSKTVAAITKSLNELKYDNSSNERLTREPDSCTRDS